MTAAVIPEIQHWGACEGKREVRYIHIRTWVPLAEKSYKFYLHLTTLMEFDPNANFMMCTPKYIVYTWKYFAPYLLIVSSPKINFFK